MVASHHLPVVVGVGEVRSVQNTQRRAESRGVQVRCERLDHMPEVRCGMEGRCVLAAFHIYLSLFVEQAQ